jgi:hypothetical protein
MRWTTLTAIAAVAATVLATLPAEAQQRRSRGAEFERTTTQRYVAQRPRASITVRKQRSYLDPGTEVLPMSRSYTDYAVPPGYRPTQVVSGPSSPAGWQNPHWPLPGAFDLPGRDNPFGFGW